jgi:hypothetical protein
MPATYYKPSSTDSSLSGDNALDTIASIARTALQAVPAVQVSRSSSRSRNSNSMIITMTDKSFASNASLFDQQNEKPENEYYLDYLQEKTVSFIKDIIRSSDPDTASKLEERIYKTISGNEDILGNIALQKDELINVRAMAARLLFARVQSQDYDLKPLRVARLCRAIENHESPLIRLGVVLGYADAGVWNRVSDFCQDQHAVVAQRARELLEDAD